MNNQSVIRPTVALFVLLTVIVGGLYPAVVTGLGKAIFPDQAGGSLVVRDGKPVGSALIGQNFTSPGYFQGRPSATTATDASGKTVDAPDKAANSGGSNLGPTAEALRQRIAADIKKLQAENPGEPIPADLVTTSGSGLDPDISPAAAYFQIPRVAAARHIDQTTLRRLVAKQVRGRTLGLLGAAHINVLELNLALDRLQVGGT